MKIKFVYNNQLYQYERQEYIDPKDYESSESDPLTEREEARINRIVWGNKIYLQPTIIEGKFSAH